MELQAYMDERRDMSLPLEIESFVPVPVDIVVEINVNDSFRQSKVVSDIQIRLGSGIRYDNYHNNNGDNEGDEHGSSTRQQAAVVLRIVRVREIRVLVATITISFHLTG